MDNVTTSPAFPDTCVIKLDQSQYAFFRKSRIEIQSPQGKVLTVISKPVPHKTDADAIYQLWCQACLLEVLFDDIEGKIKLPASAIDYITHVINRINLRIKRQMQM